MGMLDSLFQSKSVQSMAFAQVKAMLQKSGATALVITLDEDGEVDLAIQEKPGGWVNDEQVEHLSLGFIKMSMEAIPGTVAAVCTANDGDGAIVCYLPMDGRWISYAEERQYQETILKLTPKTEAHENI